MEEKICVQSSCSSLVIVNSVSKRARNVANAIVRCNQSDQKISSYSRYLLFGDQQIAGIFDFGTRGGIDLYQIDKAPLFYFTAVIADAASRGGDAGFAV